MWRMVNLPNLLTLLRLGAAPVMAFWLLQHHNLAAWALLLVAAASDFVDGRLARRWHQTTRFGAMVDPLADKATGLLLVAVLAWQGSLPLWFAVMVIARDALIVLGAGVYRLTLGTLEITPTWASKLNTALLFGLLLGVLSVRARLLPLGPWLSWLQWAVLVTTVWSGVGYVWTWSRKAHAARLVRAASHRA